MSRTVRLVLATMPLFVSGCLLEGATWRNAAGEEPSEQVVNECYQEAKKATMFYRYSPDVLRACLRERGYRPAK
jgi:hypothetical protein